MFVHFFKRLKPFALLVSLLVLASLIVYTMNSLCIVTSKRKDDMSILHLSRLARNGVTDVNNHLRLIREDFEKTLVQYEEERIKRRKMLKLKTSLRDFKSHSENLGINITCNRDLFLLIQVHSKPTNFMSRQAIRLSWGRMEHFLGDHQQIIGEIRSWETVFLVGKSSDPTINRLVAQEAAIHKDIVVGTFDDTFRNLYKKMIFGIHWPLERKCNVSYILKTDEDCYVNIGNLLHWLNSYHVINGTHPIYAGRVQKGARVVRDNNSRYYVSKKDHPESYFHPYVSGGGYVFSGILLPLLSKVSKISPLFPNEDALLGHLMFRLGVKPTDHLKFLPFIYCSSASGKFMEMNLCPLSKQIIVHGLRGTQQLKMHFNSAVLNSLPSFCSSEERYENLRNRCYLGNIFKNKKSRFYNRYHVRYPVNGKLLK